MKYLTLGLVTLISFSCSSHKHHETLEVQTLGGRLRYINRSDLGGKISNHYPNRMNAYTKITQVTFVKIGQLLRSKLEDKELRKKFLKCSNRFEIGQFIREHLSHEIDSYVNQFREDWTFYLLTYDSEFTKNESSHELKRQLQDIERLFRRELLYYFEAVRDSYLESK